MTKWVWQYEGVTITQSGLYAAICPACRDNGQPCKNCGGIGLVLGKVGENDNAFPADIFANMPADRRFPNYEDEPDADD